MPFNYAVNPNQCKIDIINQVFTNAQHLYNDYLAVHINKFIHDYKQHCLDALHETYTRKYKLDEYHYTLYYYDQAGNLARTVAPAGVVPLAITAPLGSTLAYPD